VGTEVGAAGGTGTRATRPGDAGVVTGVVVATGTSAPEPTACPAAAGVVSGIAPMAAGAAGLPPVMVTGAGVAAGEATAFGAALACVTETAWGDAADALCLVACCVGAGVFTATGAGVISGERSEEDAIAVCAPGLDAAPVSGVEATVLGDGGVPDPKPSRRPPKNPSGGIGGRKPA
jgi:hypothetical protein